MAVAAETSTAPPLKKGGRGLSFEEKRKRLSEYLLEKVVKEESYVMKSLTVLERFLPIKGFGEIGSESHWNCYTIS